MNTMDHPPSTSGTKLAVPLSESVQRASWTSSVSQDGPPAAHQEPAGAWEAYLSVGR